METSNPWINYHHLLYFKTIAEEGSVSKAAQKLRLGQPTLSAQLKQFESNLNVILFERQHKRLILTEQGEVALNYARTIFKLGNEMLEVLQDRLAPNRIHLQLGALDIIPKEVLFRLTNNAHQISPCTVSIAEGGADELLRDLTAHKLDLFISNHLPSPKEIKGLQHRSLGKTPVSIFGSPKFKNLRKEFPKSLHAMPLILPTYEGRMRADLDHWLKSRNLNVDPVAETQDISLNKILAMQSIGLIPATLLSVSHEVAKGELVEIGKLDGITEELFIISAQRRISNPIASQLMKTFHL